MYLFVIIMILFSSGNFPKEFWILSCYFHESSDGHFYRPYAPCCLVPHSFILSHIVYFSVIIRYLSDVTMILWDTCLIPVSHLLILLMAIWFSSIHSFNVRLFIFLFMIIIIFIIILFRLCILKL